MAKIGTAHVEIKPVLNEGALAEITDTIATAIRAGVEIALSGIAPEGHDHPSRSAADDEVIVTAIRNRTKHYQARG